MSKQANAKLIGAFVLGAVILIVVVFVVFGSGKMFKSTISYVVYFEGDVLGLKVGSPVKVRGVDVGSVSRITPIYDKEGNIQVEVIIKLVRDTIHDSHRFYEDMSAEEFMSHMFKKGMRARLETQSFVTGVRFIELEFYPEFPIRLVGLNDDFIEIPSIPTLVEEIETEIRQFVAKIEAIDWETVKDEFEGMLASFRTTLDEISRATKSIDLTETIASLNETLDASEELLQRINSKIDPLVEEKVDLLLSDVSKVTDVIARTMESTNRLITRFETIAVDDRYEIRAALNEFKETSRSLRILLDYIQQNPRSVIFGKEKRRK